MASYDFNAPRLYVDARLSAGARIELTRDQANYLVNVLRLASGSEILAFNGVDGEWLARLEARSKRNFGLALLQQRRTPEAGPDLHYLFAPLKHARLDYMVQKAVEMGASRLTPTLTARTQAHRVNLERMRANAIEAAQQCGILGIPEIDKPAEILQRLDSWDPQRLLVFCNEDAQVGDARQALLSRRVLEAQPVAILIGPEGGFEPRERQRILALPACVSISLGPRILRADTAAVAALTLVQSVFGDWR